MKVIKERKFTVQYVVPENEKEDKEIKRIIREVNEEKLVPDKDKWKIIDNRQKYKE